MAKSFTKPDTPKEESCNIPYFSCIRIHGMRILPPIMTQEKRDRMKYYKELAIKVENEIKSRPVSTKIVSDYTDEYAETNSSSFCDSSYTSEEDTTQIFTESYRSDVLHMLGDTSAEIPRVPLPESDKEVVKLIPEKPNCDNSSILCVENIDNQTNIETNKQTPCLIRSNSYVLETPSPYLLALMKQNEKTETKKRRTWDLETAKQKWSSIENDLNTKNFTLNSPEPERDIPFEKPKSNKTDIEVRNKTPESVEKSEHQIRDIIDRIQLEQSKQMTELIARQKKEQETLMQLFAEQQALVLSKLKSLQETVESKELLADVPEPEVLKNSEVLLTECKKILQQETNFNSSCDQNQNFSPSSNDNTISSELTLSPDVEIIRKSACSKQLFPTERQIWAATIIQSAVRGFLVRRLLNTEKVQNLIKTIRDSLMCAVELHQETVERIQPADVELHRRLILQVTSACHAFHDTFFEINRSEQLQIIATDRERLKDKLLRPQLSRNSSLTSTTQKVLERKLRRRSTDSLTSSQSVSRCSSSRSCHSDYRTRTRSLGLSDSMEKRSPQDLMRRAMSFGANKKPWR